MAMAPREPLQNLHSVRVSFPQTTRVFTGSREIGDQWHFSRVPAEAVAVIHEFRGARGGSRFLRIRGGAGLFPFLTRSRGAYGRVCLSRVPPGPNVVGGF
jgi:hypothetical protein